MPDIIIVSDSIKHFRSYNEVNQRVFKTSFHHSKHCPIKVYEKLQINK